MSDTPASRPAAGRRRFWVTVAVFALANLAAWVGYHQYNTSRLRLLRVARFEPGHEAVVGARPTLTWQFNLDVAHAAGERAPGTITPAVAGKWLWHDGRTLTFAPDADLPRATRFTVTLPADRLHTIEGIRLDRAFTDTFTTEPLHLLTVLQGGCDEQRRLIVELHFDDAVIPADAAKHLRLIDPERHAVPFQLHGNAASAIVRVQTDPLPQRMMAAVENPQLTIELTSGLAGASGPLGLTQTVTRTLPISADLMATEATADAPGHNDARIRIRFNNPVDPELLRDVLSVEPPVKYQLGSAGDAAVALSGPFEPGQRYLLKLAAPPPGVDKRKFPRPDSLSVFIPDRRQEVWFEHPTGYLGTQGNRTLLAHATNVADVRVTVTRLYDNNLVAWRTQSGGRGWDDPQSLGKSIAERKLTLPSAKNKPQDLPLSLDDLLPANAPRDGVYRVGLSTDAGASRYHRYRRYDEDADDAGSDDASAIVTLSDIGLTAKQSRDVIDVWAVSLATAKPLDHVRVRAFSNKNQLLGEATTDAHGLARIANVHPAPAEHAAVLIAELTDAAPRLAGDAQPAAAAVAGESHGLTWLDLAENQVNLATLDVGGKPYLRTGFEAFCFTERGVYRPRETLHLRAIVRGPDLAAPPPSMPLKWQLRRPDQRDWKSETVALSPDGLATLDVALPNDLPTGRWTADLSLPGDRNKPGQSFGSVAFQVEEFMPNRMKVKLDVDRLANDRASVAAGPLVAQVQADYLFGQPVADRPATLVARVEPATFAPRQWAGWTFNDTAAANDVFHGKRAVGGRVELPAATLDAKGHAKWDIEADELLNPDGDDGKPKIGRHPRATPDDYAGPWRVTLYAAVTETGGRAVNTTRTLDVDRLDWYLGVRPAKSTATPREPVEFELAAVAPDGAVSPVNATISAQLYHETWNTSLVQEGSRYRYVSTRKLDPVDRPIDVALSAGRGTCRVTPPASGAYVLVARGESGRLTSHAFYASFGAWQDNVSREDPERLEIVLTPQPKSAADILLHPTPQLFFSLWHRHALPRQPQDKVPPGGTVRALVRAPFVGQLLLTVETDSVLSTRVIEMSASQEVVDVPIPEAARPNAFVTATVLRPIDPHAVWMTHRAFGAARVNVDSADRKLAIRLATPKEIRPSSSLGIDVQVTDATGRPAAGAAVTVAAVDEGILSLTRFVTPDPFAFFTAKRAHGVRWADLYSQLMPEVARPQRSSDIGGDKGDDAPAPGRHQTPVVARRVAPVAFVTGTLHTDASGLARADFAVPDFSGQLRVMAVASAGRSFGSSESNVFVRSPLLVQSSWPRFAAPGDTFTVPLAIFNRSTHEGRAEVAIEFLDGDDHRPVPLEFTASHQRRQVLTTSPIPAGGQATLNFAVAAKPIAGVAHVLLVATLDGETYQEFLELPIRPASPTISVGGYAFATPAAPATLPAVADMLTGTASLQIRAAPRPQLELPRGLDYLDRYPYGCAEQTISGGFPLIALGDLGPAIAPGLFERERVAAKLQSAVTTLIGMQCADGGIAMWPGAHEKAWPWASAYAAHFVVEAQLAGHKVPADFRDALFGYLRGMLAEPTDHAETVEAQAYACYVLALSGKPDRAVMSRLTEVVNHPRAPRPGEYELAPQARFHLAAAWLAAGRRDLAEGLIPPSLPQPRSQRQLSGNVGSPVRDRAILLSTLLDVDPDRADLPALAQQIADEGRDGHWQSTQDAAFAVVALGKYLRHIKPGSPYDEARVFAGEKSLAFATNGQPLACDPTPTPGQAYRVTLAGPAHAKAYVSWLLTGVPLHAPLDEDAGLKVRRRYLTPKGKPIANNTVHSGDLVQVEVSVESPTTLDNVVIDDLLPAGLEVENPRLDTTADAGQVESKRDAPPNAFAHGRLDVRDDRLIVVGHVIRADAPGTFTYLARAVSPGTFAVPPIRGECMYDIATHSLHGTGQMLVVLPIETKTVARGE